MTLFLGSLFLTLDQLSIPDIRIVAHYKPLQSTLIYDRYGTIVDRIFVENRVVIPLDQMHPLLPKAFVSAEDSRFFEHPGLDSFSVLRALINNIKSRKKRQGGSTITQQVAKGLLLSPEKTYLRKFKEAILAWRIDSLLSKEEILYIYLNQIYLGEGAYGVEAAAQTYFNKSADTLRLGEIALLAGLPQAPSRYSPLKDWKKARARQRYVLNRMVSDGSISSEQAQRAFECRITLNKRGNRAAAENGYYLEEVKKRAAKMLGRSLQTAGVRIHTNLDQRMQKKAAAAILNGADKIRQRQNLQKSIVAEPQGALVCIDGCSGKVRALTGGTDYLKTPFNRAVQAHRPAGSTLKPLVYGAAFDRGMTPQSMIIDGPLSIPGSDGTLWHPQNYSGQFHGRTTIGQSFVYSYNIPAIKVLKKIGVSPVQQLAEKMGFFASFPPNLSVALGAVDVSLLEITGAYIPFVCNGFFQQPTLISHITADTGKLLYRFSGSAKRVFKQRSAQEIKGLLEQTVSMGTGRKARGLPGRSGGKTGTSDKNRDVWFIGFNDSLVCGVWFGYDRNNSLGKNVNGGNRAAPVWREFMSSVRKR